MCPEITARFFPEWTEPLIHILSGCAPSHEVLKTWNDREGDLIQACSHMDRDVAHPPLAKNVHVGNGGADIKEKVGKEGKFPSANYWPATPP